MKKHIYLLLILIGVLFMSGCQDNTLFKILYDGDVSTILSQNDDYIQKLSHFDYAAKFKSEVPLSTAEFKTLYSNAIEPYTPADIKKLNASFSKVKKGLKDYSLTLPETLYVFSESTVEAGAAYTRANAICIPKVFMNAISPDQLDRLVAHEIFHVISRYNSALRPKMYGIIGYQQTKALIIPPQLKDLTVANPDAPENNYFITCTYNGKNMNFMPLTYSETPYDAVKGGTFFDYLMDDMLAVEIKDGIPQALTENGKPLLVTKDTLENFTEQIGTNTDYTYHPEETTADHFVMLIFDDLKTLPNPELITALGDVLSGKSR